MKLSTLYNSFITEAQSEAKNYTLLDPLSAGNKIPQKRWVLSRLNRHFGNILRVTCRHFRYGTVLYHKDCDLLNAISAALGRNKELCSDASKQPGTINVLQVEESIEQTCAYNCGIETQIEIVSTHLNAKVHELAKTLIRKYQDNSKDNAAVKRKTENVDPVAHAIIAKTRYSHKHKHVQTKLTF